jgi:hypothetical protein
MNAMKKIFLITAGYVLVLYSVLAQAPIAEIWTEPAIFLADEPVSWYFDITGTSLAGETEGVYMWSWYPTEPDSGNWLNSSEFAAMTYVEGNIWRMDLTPTEYYGVEASTISAFYGLLKNKDGSKFTGAFAPDQVPPNDIKIYDLSTIKGAALIDYYPKEFSTDRPLSILVNAGNTWSKCETSAVQGDLANAENVHLHGGVNLWDIQVQNNSENLDKTRLTDLSDDVYRIDFILEDYFALPENYTLENINMVFADSSWTYEGKDVACADFLIIAPEMPEVIPPELSFYPQKISKKDILIITRKNNESNVTNLYYTITAGTATINGEFEGTVDEMTAYIDLVTPLKDITGLETINVVITDNNDRTITDTDITLIQLTY